MKISSSLVESQGDQSPILAKSISDENQLNVTASFNTQDDSNSS